MRQEPFFEFRGVGKRYGRRTGLFSPGESFYALRNLNLSLEAGKVYGLVGESGSGKTTLAKLLLGLERPSCGTLSCEGVPVQKIFKGGRREYYRRVQAIFQNPFLSLEPRWNIGKIVTEGLGSCSREERSEKCARVLDQVGLPERYESRKPSQLSGGERQRVALARALVMQPEFLILDEPTSQLDVSVQAKIMSLLKDLKASFEGGMVFITHNLALAAGFADEVLVLKKGELVETGEASGVLRAPAHEYTKRLVNAIPDWRKRRIC